MPLSDVLGQIDGRYLVRNRPTYIIGVVVGLVLVQECGDLLAVQSGPDANKSIDVAASAASEAMPNSGVRRSVSQIELGRPMVRTLRREAAHPEVRRPVAVSNPERL